MSDGTASSGAAPSGASASGGAAASQSSSQAPTSGSSTSTSTPQASQSQSQPSWSLKLDKPLVVDGIEEPVEYTDQEALRLDLQLAKAARRRMQEAARIRKEADEWRRKAKESPWEVLRAEGHDPRKLAAELLAEEAQRATLTPEQQQVLEAQRAREAAEAKLKEYESEQQTKAREAADAAMWNELEPKLVAAAERAQLPNDEQTMDLLARVGLEFAQNGVELSPEHVVAETQRRQQARTMRYVSSAPVPMLAGALKPMPVERLMQVLEASGHLEPVRAALVARWRAKRTAGQAPVQSQTPAPTNGHTNGTAQPRDDEGRYITAGEFRKRNLFRR